MSSAQVLTDSVSVSMVGSGTFLVSIGIILILLLIMFWCIMSSVDDVKLEVENISSTETQISHALSVATRVSEGMEKRHQVMENILLFEELLEGHAKGILEYSETMRLFIKLSHNATKNLKIVSQLSSVSDKDAGDFVKFLSDGSKHYGQTKQKERENFYKHLVNDGLSRFILKD